MEKETRQRLRLDVDELYAAYAGLLDDAELDAWLALFAPECTYEVTTRENVERGLPLALIRCESRGMLQDRVAAVRQTSVYAPRRLRHVIGPTRVTAAGDDVTVQANVAVFETLSDEPSRLFATGCYADRLARHGGELRFAAKRCILDSPLILGSLVYPI